MMTNKLCCDKGTEYIYPEKNHFVILMVDQFFKETRYDTIYFCPFCGCDLTKLKFIDDCVNSDLPMTATTYDLNHPEPVCPKNTDDKELKISDSTWKDARFIK